MTRTVLIAGVLTALHVAAARGEEVRTGAASFGDWRTDAPGVRRLIRPSDLPAPFATASASRAPSVVGLSQATPLRAPAGFTIEMVARGLDGPREMKVAPNGDVLLAETEGGRVRVFPADAGGRVGAQSTVFAEGLADPYGLALWPPGPAPTELYVGETNRVVRYRYRPGQTVADGKPDVVVPALPEGGHGTRDLTFSRDGKTLFVAVGSASNVAEGLGRVPGGDPAVWDRAHATGAAWGEETGRADVLAFAADGSGGAPFATGLRNCTGEAIQPDTGTLWCVVNERDGLGDNLVPDYAAALPAGGFFGWPWFYLGDHPDPRQGARPDLAGKITVPDVLIQPHSAPLGIVFYEGAAFPAEYRGDAFVALHGSWNRANRTGYKVVRLRFDGARATGEYDDFLTGFVVSDRAVWGRPVGVAVEKDGALLVSEDANGTIWRVDYPP